jgi:translation elongation factor EF-G
MKLTIILTAAILTLNYINTIKVSDQRHHRDVANKETVEDPFKLLGLEELNPKKIIDEVTGVSNNSEFDELSNIPQFIKSSKLSNEEIIQVISRYLLKDNLKVKNFGSVFDKTGHDALPEITSLPTNNPLDRCQIRARSATILFVSSSI